MLSLTLIHADCVQAMKDMEDGSIGSIVCDPPYGLRFMGKAFDDLGDGASQREWHRAWLLEAYRVLAPGGVIKAFGGTRTFHHLAAMMRKVGFQNIGLEAWTYGSGFPKSLNIGKAMDKAAGAEREVVETRVLAGKAAQDWRDKGGHTFSGGGTSAAGLTKVVPITAPATDAARTWEGWGTALKPAWEPVVVGVKP